MSAGSLYRSDRTFAAVRSPAGRETPAPPREIAFLEQAGVSRRVLDAATRSARDLGVGAEEVLIAEGAIGEEFYYRALAGRLNCRFIDRAAALASGFDYRAALRASVARADPAREDFDWLMAPRGRQIAELFRLRDRGRIAVCAPSHFSALARAKGRRALSEDASFALSRADARLSAHAAQARRANHVFIALSLVILACLLASSARLLESASLVLSVLFLGGIYVRACAIAASQRAPPPRPSLQPEPDLPEPDLPDRELPDRDLPDRELPTYTIIAPLYREAGMAAQFVAALKALDYPAAKLEVKLVVEPEDVATAAALRAAGLGPNMEIVVAPSGAPRTKPRALNVALPLARGKLLAIYDAEDRPDPDQLRIAAARFARAGPRVACLQARLVVDNGHEGWLAYFFAASYAALFDVINPGLGALGLPMPLGGTSNHFRTDLLRRVCGWDAWNVTEDADLGLRLARFGYFIEAIDSATFEDAPVNFTDWLGQRTRWMKGWMQTLAVFLRTPRRHFRRMGWRRALAAFCVMTSLIAGPLFGPFYGLRLAYDLWRGDLLAPPTVERLIFSTLSVSIAVFGALVFILPNLIGMRRRRLRPSPVLLLAPAYLLLLSFAAWRALWEWTRQPFVWTKTAHTPRPVAGADQAASDVKNFPASASAISARVLSTP